MPYDKLGRRQRRGRKLCQWVVKRCLAQALVDKKHALTQPLFGQPIDAVISEFAILVVVLPEHEIDEHAVVGHDENSTGSKLPRYGERQVSGIVSPVLVRVGSIERKTSDHLQQRTSARQKPGPIRRHPIQRIFAIREKRHCRFRGYDEGAIKAKSVVSFLTPHQDPIPVGPNKADTERAQVVTA